MKNSLYILLLLATFYVKAQDDIIKNIVAEATDNSHLEILAHELLDVVGPRLTGTPQMKKAFYRDLSILLISSSSKIVLQVQLFYLLFLWQQVFCRLLLILLTLSCNLAY